MVKMSRLVLLFATAGVVALPLGGQATIQGAWAPSFTPVTGTALGTFGLPPFETAIDSNGVRYWRNPGNPSNYSVGVSPTTASYALGSHAAGYRFYMFYSRNEQGADNYFRTSQGFTSQGTALAEFGVAG